MKKFYFTFGHDHSPGIGFYLIIKADNEFSAREKMHERWGTKWSTSYDSPEAAGIQKWNLKEVKAFDRSEWESLNPSGDWTKKDTLRIMGWYRILGGRDYKKCWVDPYQQNCCVTFEEAIEEHNRREQWKIDRTQIEAAKTKVGIGGK